jgi:hypothetical protein
LVEFKLRIEDGNQVRIGIAPNQRLDNRSNRGYYLDSYLGCNYPNGKYKQYLDNSLTNGNVVSVILYANGDIAFAVDGKDAGVAYPKVWNKIDLLYLTVVFQKEGRIALMTDEVD